MWALKNTDGKLFKFEDGDMPLFANKRNAETFTIYHSSRSGDDWKAVEVDIKEKYGALECVVCGANECDHLRQAGLI